MTKILDFLNSNYCRDLDYLKHYTLIQLKILLFYLQFYFAFCSFRLEGVALSNLLFYYITLIYIILHLLFLHSLIYFKSHLSTTYNYF